MVKTETRRTTKVVIKRAKKLDRISNLPDEILSHILFFLPTKYAVQTAAISRRWRNIWASVNNLQFDERETTTKSDFMETVDKVLIKRDNNSSIQKFSLYCFLNPSEHIHRFNHWISEVIKHNVRHLDIRINTLWQSFQFSSSIYKCQNLVSLKVSARIDLDPKISISLTRLKVLHLIYVNYINDESASMLLSGCPVVEELYIWRKLEDGVKNFHICSPKLKRFTLGYYDKYELNLDTHKVRVSAPSLEYLHLVNEYSEDIYLDDLFSLVEAKLDLSVPRLNSFYFSANKLTDLLRKISNVKRLDLYGGTRASLGRIEDYDLPMLDNLTYLELSMNSPVSKLIPQLLECAPRLKYLVLDMGRWTENLVPCWILPERNVPRCLLSSLELVEVKKWSGKIDIESLLKYILKNGVVLKKVKIFRSASSKKTNLLNELLLSPKASEACNIQLIRYKRTLSL